MKTLLTDLCSLEPLVQAHAPEMFSVLSDPAIYEFENAPPDSEDGLRERFKRLERRTSPDGAELWLNWVVRLPTGQLAGWVQATVQGGGMSLVAYELARAHWRKGLGRRAVTAMLCELQSRYRVGLAVAVLKARNYRSQSLLQDLGFVRAGIEVTASVPPEPDEIVMAKTLGPAGKAACPG